MRTIGGETLHGGSCDPANVLATGLGFERIPVASRDGIAPVPVADGGFRQAERSRQSGQRAEPIQQRGEARDRRSRGHSTGAFGSGADDCVRFAHAAQEAISEVRTP
jgi:hypothetical protein